MLSADPEELIESIVRDKTFEEDQKVIRQSLNRSITRGTGIVGGGVKVFEPYEFHKDDPRRICLYTIPYLLDDRCPVLRELVNMLWAAVDASQDLSKIDRPFINQTQRLLDDFNDKCKVTASYIDLFGAIQKYAEETSHPEEKERSSQTMGAVLKEVARKWNEYHKPEMNQNMTAMNLILKLYRCIGEEKYKSSVPPTIFHNVFVMAYDTGVDNRLFMTRLFAGARKTLKTCVAFTTVKDLHASTTYNEPAFETEYKYLHGKIEEEITRFLRFAPDKDLEGKIKVLTDRVDKIELTVKELKQMRTEQNKMQDFSKVLGQMSAFMRKMAAEGTLDSEEGKKIIEEMGATMNTFTENVEGSENSEGGASTSNSESSSCASSDETRKLRKHLIEMKKHVAEHAKAINKLIESRDKEISLHESIVASKAEWEKRAIEIEELQNDLRRDHERMEAITEGATKRFVMDQYEKSGWLGRWRLRQAFPFIQELQLK